MRIRRVVLAFILLLGVLAAGSRASAQSPGSELTEDIASDAVGEEAHVTLASVEAFPTDGGEAVFEPGTDYEEVFTYASADAETNRLLGLTRAAPLAHAAGVFVQAPEAAESVAEATPTPTSSPSEEPASGPSEPEPQDDGGDTPTQSADEPTTNDATPDPCFMISGQSCDDLLASLIEEPCDPDEKFCPDIDDPDLGDPVGDLCDPDDVGQTCVQWIAEALEQFGDPVDDLCDPNNTGQTCEQWLAAALEQVSDPNHIVTGACDPAGNGQTCEDEGYVNDYLAELLPPMPNWVVIATDAANSIDVPVFHEKCRPVIRQPPTKDGILITAKGKYTCDETHEYTYAIAGMFIAPVEGGPWKPFGTIGQDATYNSTRAFAKSTGECRSGKWQYMVAVGGQAGTGDGSDPWPHYHNTGKFKTSDPVIIKCPRVPSSIEAPSEPVGVGTE